MTPLQIKLSKILALADSSQEGEALAAVRMARQMLAQEGMSFADLLAGKQSMTSRHARAQAQAPQSQAVETASEIKALQQKVAELQRNLLLSQSQLQERNNALAAVTYRAQHLELQVTRAQQEVEKWRDLARDTANKLWDIGQQIADDRLMGQHRGDMRSAAPSSIDAFTAGEAAAEIQIQQTTQREQRRFVRSSLLDAQEAKPAIRTVRQV
jgi:chromosome segregation ATPase